MIKSLLGAEARLGAVLREAEAQEQRPCLRAEGGCGVNHGQRQHTLQAVPPVCVLSLIWESRDPGAEEIATGMLAIDATLQARPLRPAAPCEAFCSGRCAGPHPPVPC